MHHALTVAQEEPGERRASRLLADLYKALQPVERACAWVEDGDSLAGEELEALKNAMPQILQSVEALERLAGGQAKRQKFPARPVSFRGVALNEPADSGRLFWVGGDADQYEACRFFLRYRRDQLRRLVSDASAARLIRSRGRDGVAFVAPLPLKPNAAAIADRVALLETAAARGWHVFEQADLIRSRYGRPEIEAERNAPAAPAPTIIDAKEVEVLQEMKRRNAEENAREAEARAANKGDKP